MIKIKKGDLFKSTAEAYVNPVNTVGVMGKGLALEFKTRFPENYRLYEKACKVGRCYLGEMIITESKRDVETFIEPKYIINFPTKKHWRDKSELDWIDIGLIDLKKVIQLYMIGSIAIPALGCGEGGLPWQSIKTLIFRRLGNMKSIIELYEPQVR